MTEFLKYQEFRTLDSILEVLGVQDVRQDS